MYLVIKGRTEPVRNLQLEAGRDLWLIGREPSCDVILSASQVSRRHARLIFDGGQFFIEDCGSALGTFLWAAASGSGAMNFFFPLKR